MENSNLLKPLYKQLLMNLESVEEGLWTFFPQEGSNFETSDYKMLFVGKATNGWQTASRDVDNVLFNKDCEERIVDRDDELEWVLNLWGNKDKNHYNTKRSAFWRVIRRIVLSSERNCSEKDWSSFLSWSNLYKVSLEAGNPPAKLQLLQQEDCCAILNKELEILKPRNIIFFTSGWEQFYLKSIGFQDYRNLESESRVWGKNNYETFAFDADGINFIVSQHPQGKAEVAHANAICSLLNA